MKKVLSLSLSMILAASVALAGCGNDNDSSSQGSGEGGGSAAESSAKIGMVTDVGGVNDKSFNQSAWEALEAVKEETGADVKYLQSKSDADYNTNLNTFVKDQYSLTWELDSSWLKQSRQSLNRTLKLSLQLLTVKSMLQTSNL